MLILWGNSSIELAHSISAKSAGLDSRLFQISLGASTLNQKPSLLFFAFLALGGCAVPVGTGSGHEAKPAQFTTDVVKRQNLIGYSFFDGKMVIPATAIATAYSPYDAPVAEVLTQLGKRVQRGAPIVKLTIQGADEAAKAAKADLSASRTSYIAQKGDTAQPVQDAQNALKAARANELETRNAIASGGEGDMAYATSMRVDAETALAAAKQIQRQALAPTKNAMDSASSLLADAHQDAKKGIVRAPISGTVTSLDAKPGLAATAKQSLAVIVNFSQVNIQGLVPAELKDLVKKHSPVIIAMTGKSSDPIDGTVTDIDVVPPSAGQTGNGYMALIMMKNPGALIQPNNLVRRIGVRSGSANGVLTVPQLAIHQTNGKATVTLKSGDAWIETPITTGISDGALTEVKSGLKEGSEVRIPVVPRG